MEMTPQALPRLQGAQFLLLDSSPNHPRFKYSSCPWIKCANFSPWAVFVTSHSGLSSFDVFWILSRLLFRHPQWFIIVLQIQLGTRIMHHPYPWQAAPRLCCLLGLCSRLPRQNAPSTPTPDHPQKWSSLHLTCFCHPFSEMASSVKFIVWGLLWGLAFCRIPWSPEHEGRSLHRDCSVH